MRNYRIFCGGLAAACMLAAAPAFAQVYSWRDPATGQSRFSNIAPPWYSRGESVNGPRVTATVGGRLIDDTALAYEDRLLLWGRSKESVDKLRLQKQQAAEALQPAKREPANGAAAAPSPGDKTATRGAMVRNKGS